MPPTYVFLAAVFIMLASLSGVFFLQKKQQAFLDKNLPFLISFSAGVFLIVSGHLVFESYEILISAWKVGLLVLIGYIGAWLVERLIPESHHHHDDCCDGHHHTGRKVIIADGIHNIADGLILAVAFAIEPLAGFLLAGSIFVHEFLQEISEFFIFKQAGYSNRKALLTNFLVSATILIGVVAGILLADSYLLQAIILAISAGFFLNLVFRDLIPHRHEKEDVRVFFKHLVVLVIGLVFMFSVLFALGHSHSHEGHDHEEHQEENHEH